MKIFGKDLFKKKGISLHQHALAELEKSEFLPDFYRDIGNQSPKMEMTYTIVSDGNGNAAGIMPTAKEIKKDSPITAEKLTPKNVYEMKMLNQESFRIKTDSEYVEKQLEDFKERLNMINNESYDMRRGLIEIASIVTRLENRRKYPKYANFYEQYPYTLSGRIEDLTTKHTYLKLGQVAEFVADLPKEAIDTMKEYTKTTKELCGKKPVFYIVADKKDFQKTTKRRDPILLAQSPFGHVWQILGAWDKEMLIVDEL